MRLVDKERRLPGYPLVALLNQEGMRLFGDIFVNGEVPVLSPIPIEAEFQDLDEIKKIYLVNLELLRQRDSAGYQQLLTRLSIKFNTPELDLEETWDNEGLPLREELTTGVCFEQRYVI